MTCVVCSRHSGVGTYNYKYRDIDVMKVVKSMLATKRVALDEFLESRKLLHWVRDLRRMRLDESKIGWAICGNNTQIRTLSAWGHERKSFSLCFSPAPHHRDSYLPVCFQAMWTKLWLLAMLKAITLVWRVTDMQIELKQATEVEIAIECVVLQEVRLYIDLSADDVNPRKMNLCKMGARLSDWTNSGYLISYWHRGSSKCILSVIFLVSMHKVQGIKKILLSVLVNNWFSGYPEPWPEIFFDENRWIVEYEPACYGLLIVCYHTPLKLWLLRASQQWELADNVEDAFRLCWPLVRIQC